MRLRTFTAESMPKAFALVKAELGEDAIILSTEEKKDGVYITAAMEPDSQPAPRQPSSKHHASSYAKASEDRPNTMHHAADELRFNIQHAFRFHNIPELFISKMSAKLNDADMAAILAQGRMNIANESKHFLKLALEQICGRFFQFAPLPPRLMIVGTPGIGKTLAIAKLATRYALAREKTVVITTDTERAGGAHQLQSFTDILGVSMTLCADKKSLAATLKQAGDAHVLIDTAGCNPYDDEALAHLAAMAKASGTELALVMQAGLDAQEALDAAEAFMELPITSLIATRTDCARRMGGVLATAAAYKLPFSVESGSASVAEAMQVITAKTLVQHLLKPL